MNSAVPVGTQRAPSHRQSPSGETRPASPGALTRLIIGPPVKGHPAADQGSNLRRVPDLSHLWQRFLLASALIFGLLLGVAATVFGYSNTAPVNIGWSIFHVDGIPLCTVAIVPLAVVLVAGTLYHWFNSLHHFTEHMRHRRRVHELEGELTKLRAHMDQLLEMPEQSGVRLPARDITPIATEPEPAPALPEAPAMNGEDKSAKKARKKAAPAAIADTEPVAVAAGSAAEVEPREETPAEA